MSHAETWQRICAAVDISTPAKETWLRPLELVAAEAGSITLAAASQFNAETVTKRYAAAIATAAAAVLGRVVRVQVTVQGQALNNLNFNISGSTGFTRHDPTPEDPGHSSKSSDLNNLKLHEKKGGVPRRQLYEDPALSKAMSWGVEEWLVQVCIRDYGIDAVKRAINKIYTLPQGYFKPQYGPIPQQCGRIFNKEMQKLKTARRVG